MLRDLIAEGAVTKIDDDLNCRGESADELLHSWRQIFQPLKSKCDLCPSTSKTIIAPVSTTILSWIWSFIKLPASPHHVAAVSKCSTPNTGKSLRSFIGACKVLSEVVMLLLGSHNLNKNIIWSDKLLCGFNNAKEGLSSQKAITLPMVSYLLWILSDSEVKKPGVAATLSTIRTESLSC